MEFLIIAIMAVIALLIVIKRQYQRRSEISKVNDNIKSNVDNPVDENKKKYPPIDKLK